jgi:hypothetical protein
MIADVLMRPPPTEIRGIVPWTRRDASASLQVEADFQVAFTSCGKSNSARVRCETLITICQKPLYWQFGILDGPAR